REDRLEAAEYLLDHGADKPGRVAGERVRPGRVAGERPVVVDHVGYIRLSMLKPLVAYEVVSLQVRSPRSVTRAARCRRSRQRPNGAPAGLATRRTDPRIPPWSPRATWLSAGVSGPTGLSARRDADGSRNASTERAETSILACTIGERTNSDDSLHFGAA